MKGFPALAALLLVCFDLDAQTELVREHYFPAELEFRELAAVKNEQSTDDLSAVREFREPRLLAEAGFQNYRSRVYRTEPDGSLTIEVIRLRDAKAAYSLLTLLGGSVLSPGPPGDLVATEPSAVLFAQGRFLVRVLADRASDLPRRVAVSVANRIGVHEPAPHMVSRFPGRGLEPQSVRYFLGPESLGAYAYSGTVKRIELPPDVEVAQARYRIDGAEGTLALVGFPTSQLAQDYYERLFQARGSRAAWIDRPGLYLKRSGPLVGILEGSFAPPQADRILASVEFTYSIQWIYDKRQHGPRTVWGIPMGILGTVVRSLVFTGLLCVVSTLSGLLIAVTRVLMRRYAPGNPLDRPERTEIIRLKLNEN